MDYEALLTDGDIRLWPYSGKLMSEDMLGLAWLFMQQESLTHRVFWAHRNPTINLFLGLMATSLPLIVTEGNDLAGLVWFENVKIHHRADIGLYYKKPFWGKKSRRATHIATEYAHQALDIPYIWGFSPWKEIVYHGQSIGYKLHTVLPKYAIINDEAHDLYVMLKEK